MLLNSFFDKNLKSCVRTIRNYFHFIYAGQFLRRGNVSFYTRKGAMIRKQEVRNHTIDLTGAVFVALHTVICGERFEE